MPTAKSQTAAGQERRHTVVPEQGSYSPWGIIDTATREFRRGGSVVAVFASTPSHGGVWVHSDEMERIPGPYRATDHSVGGWFEEDGDWAIPYVFLRLGPLDDKDRTEQALKTLLNDHPGAYAAFTGRAVLPGQSRAADKAHFLEIHANDWIVRGAWSDGSDWVPAGKTGCCATCATSPGERWYLVPRIEYGGSGGRFGFVIDEARHEEISPPDV